MNDNKLHSILTVVKGVLMVLGFVFGILLMLKGSNAVLGPGRLADEEKSLKENIGLWQERLALAASDDEKEAIQDNISAIEGNISFNGILTFTMTMMQYLIYAGLILAVLFAVYLTVSDIKGNIGSLIGIGVFGLIVALCWFTASDAMLEAWKLRDPELFNPGFVKFSDFSIKLVAVFGALAIVLIALGWVWGLVKRFSA